MHLFVYGTLLRGLSRNHVLHSAQYDWLALCRGTLVDLRSYPALIGGNGTVLGEVYTLDSASLVERLDEIEGYRVQNRKNSLYVRKRVLYI